MRFYSARASDRWRGMLLGLAFLAVTLGCVREVLDPEPPHLPEINPATGREIPWRPWTPPIIFQSVAVTFECEDFQRVTSPEIRDNGNVLGYDDRELQGRKGRIRCQGRVISSSDEGGRVRVYKRPSPREKFWLFGQIGEGEEVKTFELHWVPNGLDYPIEVQAQGMIRWYIGTTLVAWDPELGVVVETPAGLEKLPAGRSWIQLNPRGELVSS